MDQFVLLTFSHIFLHYCFLLSGTLQARYGLALLSVLYFSRFIDFLISDTFYRFVQAFPIFRQHCLRQLRYSANVCVMCSEKWSGHRKKSQVIKQQIPSNELKLIISNTALSWTSLIIWEMEIRNFRKWWWCLVHKPKQLKIIQWLIWRPLIPWDVKLVIWAMKFLTIQFLIYGHIS